MGEGCVVAILAAAEGITLTWQSIITAGAVVGALSGLAALVLKFVRWLDRQKKQDAEIKELRAHHDKDNRAVQDELAMLTYGVLACLKGLQEKGCNGPVTEAVNKIEKYINLKAHNEEVNK